MKELLGIVAARRPRRLPPGHPLVRRRLGLFPDLHAGRDDRRPAVDAAKRAVPEIPAAISRGDFAPLMAWLRRTGAWPGLALELGRAGDARQRQAARSRDLPGASGAAVSGLAGICPISSAPSARLFVLRKEGMRLLPLRPRQAGLSRRPTAARWIPRRSSAAARSAPCSAWHSSACCSTSSYPISRRCIRRCCR